MNHKNNYIFYYKNRNVLSEIFIKKYHLLGRLDYNVPGILFFSKKKRVFVFEKQYLSLVFGSFPLKKKIINVCSGKISSLIARKLFFLKNSNMSLIIITILTGRKNQIRKQLNFIGFPIVMDDKYGDFFLNNFFNKNNIYLIYNKFSYLCYNYKIHVIKNIINI
ncbi:pseudouridine synthase [Candidatus Vidania fulgoroideorum]